MLGQLSGMVEDFILGSRKKYGAQAVPLSAGQRSSMQPFFPPEILDQTRLLWLRDQRVQDPPFYGMARMLGFKNLPSFADTAAVTFVDVIVSHQEFTDELLFHELVHAVQYAQLGSKEFASHYINGFINGGGYDEIPLEKHASELERRYRADKAQAFSVAGEVNQAIANGQL